MLHRQNKSRFSLEYLFHRIYQSKQREFSRDVETLATKSSMLCVLPSLTLPVSDSKSTKIFFDPIQTLSITFFPTFYISSCDLKHTGLALETHGREESNLHWLPAERHPTHVEMDGMWSHLPSPCCCVRWGTCEQPPAALSGSCRSCQWGPSGATCIKQHTLVRKWPGSSKDNFMLSCSKPWAELSLHLQNSHTCRMPCTKDTRRALQPMAVYTFDFSTNSLLRFYVKNKHCTFYVCQILESSIQNTT